jgi:hypothetical protein
MFLPEAENGIGSLEGAAAGEVEDCLGAAGDPGLIKIGRGEAGEVARGVELAENFEGVFTFAKDVIDLREPGEVATGETFLVWNEDVCRSRGEPARENSFEEDVGIEGVFATKPSRENGNFAAVAYGDLVSR